MKRETADEYAAFVYGLCGLPPGPERERCAAEIVRTLLAMYTERGGSPPQGLREFAGRVGVEVQR